MEYEEKKRKPDIQPPAWRSSDGRLKEWAGPRGKLTGYESSERERRSGTAPRQVGELRSAYGSVASGVSRADGRRSLTLVVSRRRSKEGPQPDREAQVLQAERAVRVRPARGVYLTGNLRPEKSAFGYRESLEKSPYIMRRKMKALVRRRKHDALKQMLPFLSDRKEGEELKDLRREERAHTEAGIHPPRELVARKEALRAVISDKHREEKRFTRHLERTVERARRTAVARPLFETRWLAPLREEPEGPPDEAPESPPGAAPPEAETALETEPENQ